MYGIMIRHEFYSYQMIAIGVMGLEMDCFSRDPILMLNYENG